MLSIYPKLNCAASMPPQWQPPIQTTNHTNKRTLLHFEIVGSEVQLYIKSIRLAVKTENLRIISIVVGFKTQLSFHIFLSEIRGGKHILVGIVQKFNDWRLHIFISHNRLTQRARAHFCNFDSIKTRFSA